MQTFDELLKGFKKNVKSARAQQWIRAPPGKTHRL